MKNFTMASKLTGFPFLLVMVAFLLGEKPLKTHPDQNGLYKNY